MTIPKLELMARIYDDPEGPRVIRVRGQVARAHRTLVRRGDGGASRLEAMDDGCSHRFSTYVDLLRGRERLTVVTVRESGTGDVWWGRHVLRTRVELVEASQAHGGAHV